MSPNFSFFLLWFVDRLLERTLGKADLSAFPFPLLAVVVLSMGSVSLVLDSGTSPDLDPMRCDDLVDI